MNDALGNVGSTVVYTQTVETHPMDQRAGLAELVGEMNAGTVSLLLILGGNPVYTAPSDLKFAEAMDKVPLRANLSQFHDETAALCHWHIPETHFLEMWSDVRGHDGTASIVQPLIAPLYNGRSDPRSRVHAQRGGREIRLRHRALGTGAGEGRGADNAGAAPARLHPERRSARAVARNTRRSRRSTGIGDDGCMTA